MVRMTPSIQKLHASTLDWTSSSQVPQRVRRRSEMLTLTLSTLDSLSVVVVADVGMGVDNEASVVSCRDWNKVKLVPTVEVTHEIRYLVCNDGFSGWAFDLISEGHEIISHCNEAFFYLFFFHQNSTQTFDASCPQWWSDLFSSMRYSWLKWGSLPNKISAKACQPSRPWCWYN